MIARVTASKLNENACGEFGNCIIWSRMLANCIEAGRKYNFL